MENTHIQSINTTNTGVHIALSNPEPQRPSEFEVKQIVRILRELARDIKTHNVSIKMPSSWLWRNIVQSHYCTMNDVDWRTTISWTLTHIALCTCPTRRRNNTFVETRSRKSLFPNQEDFTLGDLYQLSTTLLDHLNTQNTQH